MIDPRTNITNRAVKKRIRQVVLLGFIVLIYQIVDSVPIRLDDAIENSIPVPRVTVRQRHQLGSTLGLHLLHKSFQLLLQFEHHHLHIVRKTVFISWIHH